MRELASGQKSANARELVASIFSCKRPRVSSCRSQGLPFPSSCFFFSDLKFLIFFERDALEVRSRKRMEKKPSRVAAEKKLKSQPLGSQHLVPGMSQYSDDVGSEDFCEADQDSAAISQRCEFFELSPS